MSIIPTLFDINNNIEWKSYLDKYGYVVIKNILNDIEQQNSIDLFKKDINYVSPKLDLNDISTWNINNTPMMFHKGMCVFNGFGQCDFMWSLRTNNNILSIYKKLFDTDELCVSMDGFSLFLSDKQKTKSWLHIDQNPSDTFYSIQGSYNFYKVGLDDAGFVIVPKSHRTYNPQVKHKRNWIQCDNSKFKDLSKKLLIPSNCFTLWNSRLIHCNAGISNNKNKNKINRLTCYITYLPKKFRTQTILQERINAYKESCTTSHWSNKCEIKKYPWGFGKRYIDRGFDSIKSTLINTNIPSDRLKLI